MSNYVFKELHDIFEVDLKCVLCDNKFRSNLFAKNEDGKYVIDDICSDCLAHKNNSF